MPRFFVTPDAVFQNEIKICNGDVNHIKNVLRMQVGDELFVCDGKGNDYECRISELGGDEIKLEIISAKPSACELEKKIYLFQGLPKSDKMELIIQKAVELGVYEIIPTATARCIAKLDAKKEEKKLARWQGISEAAAKQSGRGIIPEIKKQMSFKEALEYARDLDCTLVPYEKAEGMAETRSIISSLKDKGSVAVFIGPEGGFEEKEIELAVKNNACPITLGKRILRTETAGLALLSVLMMEFEK